MFLVSMVTFLTFGLYGKCRTLWQVLVPYVTSDQKLLLFFWPGSNHVCRSNCKVVFKCHERKLMALSVCIPVYLLYRIVTSQK